MSKPGGERGPLLEVRAFGSLSITTNSEQLGHGDLVGKKPRLLLERLIIGRNSVVHKSAIAEALWPRQAPQNASATIESYVSLLRKRLFDDRNLAREVIMTSTEGYRLNTDAIDLDLDRFDELTLRAAQLGPGRRSLELRAQADAMRRGVLLQDALDESWIVDQRQVYQDRASLNLIMIAKGQLASGLYPAAIRSAEAAISVERFSEEAYRLVMLSHYALGMNTLARAAFERIRDLVWTELHVDLTTATEDLAAAIDAGECPSQLIARATHGQFGSPHQRVVDVHSTASPTPAPESRSASRRMPFLGRETELGQLDRLVQSNAGFKVALVSGNYGMGKTTLLNRFQQQAGTAVGRTDYRSLTGPARRQCAHGVFCAIAGALGEADLMTPRVEPDRDLATLLGPVVDRLRANGPMTLLLDDLDTADPSDFALLAWLQRSASDVPLTVVGTVSGPAGAARLGDRGLTPDLTLDVGPLRPADVEPYGPNALEVLELCMGNPRFMADVWRWKAAGLSGPPESLVAYVERRLHLLRDPLVDALAILTKLSTSPELGSLAEQLESSLATVNDGLAMLAPQTQGSGLAMVEAKQLQGAA